MAHIQQDLVTDSFYVYRHVRLDRNEVFYIGIGKKTCQDLKYGTYHRANSKRDRNQFWCNITSKTKFIVEVVLDNLIEKEVKEKEREFIELYGRRDLKKGTLCNLTDGGEGFLNLSQSAREKLRESKLGNKNPRFGKGLPDHLKKLISSPSYKSHFCGNTYRPASKKVVDLETGVYYSSIKEASKSTVYEYKCFKAMLNGQNKNKTSFIICKN